MANFVLIHGMWHGGWCWKKVTPRLRAAGYEIYIVTLTGVGERAHLHYPDIDMNTHIQDVVSVLEYENLNDVILVGHSLAGFMALAVAERVPERIAHIVNLDGVLPIDDKPFKDLMPDFWDNLRQRARANGDEWWSPPILEWTFGVTGDDLAWMQSKLTPHPLKTWETPFPVGAIPSRVPSRAHSYTAQKDTHRKRLSTKRRSALNQAGNTANWQLGMMP